MTTSIHAQDHQSFDIQCVPDRLQNDLKKNITRDRPGISLTPIRWGKGSESPYQNTVIFEVDNASCINDSGTDINDFFRRCRYGYLRRFYKESDLCQQILKTGRFER